METNLRPFLHSLFELAFLTTMTGFNAPQNITLEEIRIESYIPLDNATDEFCKRLPI